MAIIMVGLNCGTSLVPFAVSTAWGDEHNPALLWAGVSAAQAIAYPVMLVACVLHRRKVAAAGAAQQVRSEGGSGKA
jgi:hypothetical protein